MTRRPAFGGTVPILNNLSRGPRRFKKFPIFGKNARQAKSWASAKITTENKWLEIFHHFETIHVPYNNTLKSLECALSLPETNAATERVFSTLNKVWTPAKSQLSVETLKAILCVKYNLTNSCEKSHDLLNNDSNLLKKFT